MTDVVNRAVVREIVTTRSSEIIVRDVVREVVRSEAGTAPPVEVARQYAVTVICS